MAYNTYMGTMNMYIYFVSKSKIQYQPAAELIVCYNWKRSMKGIPKHLLEIMFSHSSKRVLHVPQDQFIHGPIALYVELLVPALLALT